MTWLGMPYLIPEMSPGKDVCDSADTDIIQAHTGIEWSSLVLVK